MSDSDIIAPEAPSKMADSAELAAPVSLPASTSWQEQDVLLRTLWVQNKTPQEISAALGRSVAAIMTRAARLGLPRRAAPGRKPGSHRSLQPGQVRVTSARPASNKPLAEGSPQPSARICLMCLRSFPSLGRHNRICTSCKNSSEYESASSLSDINLPI